MTVMRRHTLFQRKPERQDLKCVVGTDELEDGIKELEDDILDHCVRIAWCLFED